MATTAASPASRRNGTKRIIWFWQSNLNPYDDKEKEEWKRYSDFECDFIEDAYQRKEQEVQLNDYIISFKQKMQSKKEDRYKQRPIKCEEVDISQYGREERFCFPDRVVKSFDTGYRCDSKQFTYRWFKKNEELVKSQNFPTIAAVAAQGEILHLKELKYRLFLAGILEESKLLNQEFDAQRMADQIRNCTSTEDILACIVRLYSAESFLYKSVNSTMRNEDTSKLDTLGPFCWLLSIYLSNNQDCPEQCLYCGATLTDQMIEEYKQALHKEIIWLSFTSTSKDRRVAEMFGNTLFIISMKKTWRSRSNISSQSLYPHEQEVLVDEGHHFFIDKVERDQIIGKFFIHLTMFQV